VTLAGIAANLADANPSLALAIAGRIENRLIKEKALADVEMAMRPRS
jgi:hypothetical protein